MNEPVAPVSYWSFCCIGSECEDNCCHSWDVNVTRREIARVSSATRRPERDFARVGPTKPSRRPLTVLKRRADGACHFQLNDGLCELQRDFSAATLPTVCKEFPRSRVTRGELASAWLTPACPEAVRLMLRSPMELRGDGSEGSLSQISLLLQRIACSTPEGLVQTLVLIVDDLSSSTGGSPHDLEALRTLGRAFLHEALEHLESLSSDELLAAWLHTATEEGVARLDHSKGREQLQPLLWHLTWMFSQRSGDLLRALGEALFFCSILTRLGTTPDPTGCADGPRLWVSATYRCFRQLHHNELLRRHVSTSAAKVSQHPEALIALVTTLE